MPDSRSPSSDSAGHDRRLLFVACSLVAVTVGGVLVASVGGGGLAGSPIDSILPGEDVSADQTDIEQSLGGGSSDLPQRLGSLTPGSQTGAGGEIALDNDTFASTDTRVHFLAKSTEPTYWRTASYGTYTGTGWERNSSTESYNAPLHDSGFERIEYNVTLREPANALPTPWQPTAIGGIDESSLEVVADGSVQPSDLLSNGTTFTGVSQAPPSTPAVLRLANDTTPPELERFTELPGDTPDRVAVKTSTIVSGVEGRYDTAVAVQNWLRESKEYSLEAYRDSNSVADTFIFEMDAGYCEYFATAMTTMLRTQDIPARYAVGYTSGQSVDNNSYQVRGMNAHAWVEVYFPEIGWVQFDPTPGGPRLQTQQQALQTIGEEYEVTDPASPGETFDLETENQTETGEWSVDLNRTAIPGVTVEATVSYNGTPRGGLQVAFDGSTVGTTDRRGTVTGTVPGTDSFEVNVTTVPGERVRPPTGRTVDGELTLALDGLGGTGVFWGDLHATESAAPLQNTPSPDQAEDREISVYNDSIDVTTDADIEIDGEVVPGNEVAVTALVGGGPLADATVSVGGEERGRTSRAGRVTLRVPSSPGAVTVVVERGRVSGERSVDVPALDVETSVEWPVAVPFAPATAEATYDGDPAVGVPVAVNGETVGTTGTDGRVSFGLPLARSADITAIRYGTTAGTVVGGLLATALLLVGLSVAVVGGLVLLARRSNPSASGFTGALGRVGEGVGALGRLLTQALLAAADRLEPVSDAVGSRVRDTVQLVLVALGLADPAADTGADPPGRRDRPVAVDPGDGGATETQAAVRAAWDRFLAHVSAPAATNTPGELATHAIEQDDLPASAVWTLRDAFRAVEYGGRPADPDRVRAAVEAIETATADRVGPPAGAPGEDGEPAPDGGQCPDRRGGKSR